MPGDPGKALMYVSAGMALILLAVGVLFGSVAAKVICAIGLIFLIVGTFLHSVFG